MLASLVTSSVALVIIFVAHVDRTIPGLIDVSQPLPLAHFILGIIITGAQMTNAALSLCRCKPSHAYRWIYNIVHGKFIGYSTVKLAGMLLGDIKCVCTKSCRAVCSAVVLSVSTYHKELSACTTYRKLAFLNIMD